jgi:hypothetical protein
MPTNYRISAGGKEPVVDLGSPDAIEGAVWPGERHRAEHGGRDDRGGRGRGAGPLLACHWEGAPGGSGG